MFEMAGKIKGFRHVLFGIALVAGILITLLGGGIFTSFGVLFVCGFFIGWQGKKFKQLFDDYKLGLRVNAIMFSSRVMEDKEKERNQLHEEIRQLRERIAAQNLLIERKEGASL